MDLHNLAEATTIHWHGIKQFGTPYMDGVPFVTQCPILGQDSFRYVFRPREVGTYFWHSHMSFQRTDGTYGMFIIRQPPYYDANSYLYDYDLTEHAIVFADWPIRLGDEEFIEFVDSDVVLNPRSLLVNGRGKYKTFRDEFDNAFYTPRAQFNVTRGYRYRFRLCSSTNYICPVQFSIDNHSLLVIATDGNPVEPYRVDSIVLNSAERFDFVLDANQEIDSYWMRFRGFLECGSVFSTAVLYYNGSNSSEPLESTVSQSPFGTVSGTNF